MVQLHDRDAAVALDFRGQPGQPLDVHVRPDTQLPGKTLADGLHVRGAGAHQAKAAAARACASQWNSSSDSVPSAWLCRLVSGASMKRFFMAGPRLERQWFEQSVHGPAPGAAHQLNISRAFFTRSSGKMMVLVLLPAISVRICM